MGTDGDKYGEARMVLNAGKESLGEVRNLVKGVMLELGFKTGTAEAMETCVVEHCENIIKYGYESGPGEFELVIAMKHPVAEIMVADCGREFNLMAQELPELSGRLKKGIGGKMGIRIIKSMCDAVLYKRENGRNFNTFIMMDEQAH